jgi:hypothetical protein
MAATSIPSEKARGIQTGSNQGRGIRKRTSMEVKLVGQSSSSLRPT